MRVGWNRIVGPLEVGGGNRIRPMEGMRGVAVTLVFFVHYYAVFGAHWQADTAMRILGEIGHYGVDLFFMLSGFLIYGAVIRRPVMYGPFMKRRLQRLYPTFLVMFATYVGLSFVFPSVSKLPEDGYDRLLYLLQNLLMLPGLFPIEPMITVAWSLSFEIFFYLVVPLLVAMGRLRGWSPGQRIALYGVMGAAILLWARILDMPLHARMVLFLSGMVLYDWRLIRKDRPIPASVQGGGQPEQPAVQAGRSLGWIHAAAVPLALLLLPVGYVLETSETLEGWALYVRTAWLALTLPVVGMSAFSGTGPLAAPLTWAPLRWLGNMSYSYYLLHALVVRALGPVVGKFAPGMGAGAFWLACLPTFALTLVTSYLLYVAIEYPLSLAPASAPRVAAAR